MQTVLLHSCRKPGISIAANVLAMQGLEEDHRLVRGLVDWSGLAPSRVAAEIGVAATTITRHYNGQATTRLGRQTLAKMRERFPDYSEFATRNNNIRSEVAQFGDRPFDEKFGRDALPDIPVLGSVLGMTSFDPERDIELAELDMTEVLGHVPRPISLADDGGAYAVTVFGDSMYPRFRPGRRLIVSPRAPVSIGDDVIVQLRGAGEDQLADRVTLVLIKELARRGGEFIELRQFKPETTFRIETSRVVAIHKVIGEVY